MIKQKFKQTEIGKIPVDWEIEHMEELGVLKNGINYNRSAIGPGLKVVSVKQLFRGELVSFQDLDSVKKEKISNYESYLLNEGDLLFARGSLKREGAGKLALVKNLPEKNIVFSGFIILFRNKSKNYNLFLNYLLRSPVYRELFPRIATGTTITNLTQDILKKVPIICPPLSEQSAIAKILSDLDAKIELNNKMNKTLEAIGQAIFKKWFVDERKKEWKEGFLGDGELTEILGSGIDEFSGEKIYIATADIENSNITNYNTKITFENRPSRANMQLIPNTIWFAKMKESKKIFLVSEINKFEMESLIFSTGFTGLKVKSEALYYVWNFINSDSFETLKDNLSIGTTMQGINNDLIKRIKIMIPDKATLKKFNEVAQGIYSRVYINNCQNQSLAQIRDSLLPKLMSGEIRVNVK